MQNAHLIQPPTFWKEIGLTFRLAFPIAISQLLQNSLGVLDTVMVGQVSVDAVAACSFASNIFCLPLLFGFGFLGMVPVLVARAHGRGDTRDQIAVLKRALVVSLVMSALFAALISVLSYHLDFFRQPPPVTAQAGGFLLIIAWSIMPLYISQTLKQYCEAVHAPSPPMVILWMSLPLNAFLNWILIYGHCGSPALGLMGAGWATLITRSAMVVALAAYIWVYLWPDHSNDLPAPSAANPRPYREMFLLGLPVGIQVLLEVGFFSAAAVMMGWISENALAAHQITMSIASTTFMVPLGISMAIGIRVSHAFAQGHIRQARTIARGALLLSVGFMSFCTMAICCFRFHLAGLFVHDPAVIALAAQLLLITGLFQVFDGIQIACMGALRGMEDVQAPTVITLCCYWLICLPLSYYVSFGLHWGAQGVWLSMLFGLFFSAVALVWRLETRFALRLAVRS